MRIFGIVANVDQPKGFTLMADGKGERFLAVFSDEADAEKYLLGLNDEQRSEFFVCPLKVSVDLQELNLYRLSK